MSSKEHSQKKTRSLKKKKKTTRNGNAEEVDRLSSLPDDLVHRILSFIDIKDAIGTSTLSSRWRFVWTSMTCLDFSNKDFLGKFSEFVTQFLSYRNNQIEVSSLDISFYERPREPTELVLRNVLEYANSHNIQQLNVHSTFSSKSPHSFFSSQSLKHLSIKIDYGKDVMDLHTLELPALTTLYLGGLAFSNDNSDKCIAHFSKCPNLKNLTIADCEMTQGGTFGICHPRLSNLTLRNNLCFRVVNLVAPQLENLIISLLFRSRTDTEYVISAPNLASLVYDAYEPLHISTYDIHSLKEANICVYDPQDEHAHQMVCMLQQLHNVKFLKLNLEIIEILSSSLEPILNQPSPFANLKSLKICPAKELSEEEEQKRVKMSNEVKKYLLHNSPSATFTMVTREEIRAEINTELAINRMEELRVMLESAKAMTKTKRKTKRNIVEHVDRCLDDWALQFEQERGKISVIFSHLSAIKELLKKLPPTSKKREELQTCYSSLCVEANTFLKNILDDMKIQCEMKERRLSVYIDELAQTSEASS